MKRILASLILVSAAIEGNISAERALFLRGCVYLVDESRIDYAKSFSDYLLSHGMSSRQLDALILALK